MLRGALSRVPLDNQRRRRLLWLKTGAGPAAAERFDQRDTRHQSILLQGQRRLLVGQQSLQRADHSGVNHGARVVFIERHVRGGLRGLHGVILIVRFMLQDPQCQQLILDLLDCERREQKF